MLDDIVASIEARLPDIIARQEGFQSAESVARRPFDGALARPGLSVIAEIKRHSPSRGVLKSDLDPGAQGRLYEQGGAAAISVLTERDHFNGSPEDLQLVRRAVDLPVLRKDFIVHPAQIWESVAIGADAILLIVAILSDRDLRSLLTLTEQIGLPALVEVHSIEEAERAQTAGASIVGVNNRDLRTFEVDLTTAERIIPLLDPGILRVAESGIHSPEDAGRMAAAGFDAVLVGESLVRAEEPAELVRRFGEAGS
jgi:indole-3-glycerol phosphate synthase